MYASALLLAAGRGRRFGAEVSKPLFLIGGRPLVAYSLAVLERHPGIHEIILVANRKNVEQLRRIASRYPKVSRIVQGGKERQDSVRNGLRAICPQSRLVLVHDAARPFATAQLITALIKSVTRTGAAIAAVPVKPTIKEVARGLIRRTLPRQSLWEAQTPQVFRRQLLEQAYQRFGHIPVTDDAMLVEKVGAKVRVVCGAYSNIKITTPEDIVSAQALAGHLRRAYR